MITASLYGENGEILWDGWRETYPSMTHAEMRDFNNEVARRYPLQRHFDADLVAQFVQEVQPETVVDLGGWDGALAATVLPGCPSVLSWETWDISLVPQACDSARYSVWTPDEWVWEAEPRNADLLIASHTLEHLTGDQIGLFFAKHQFGHVLVDVPMQKQWVPGWKGYIGTHVLELSQDELLHLIVACGYEVLDELEHGDCTLMTFKAADSREAA